MFNAPLRRVKLFFLSLWAYFLLFEAGFNISHSKNEEMGTEMFRFWWKDAMIEDMADIDHTGTGRWNTMLNGSAKSLSGGPSIFTYPQVIKVYPYRVRSRCLKCGEGHVLENPLQFYKPNNTLERVCRSCGFSWPEICKDGSPPTVPFVVVRE